jgi:hypothetical protein
VDHPSERVNCRVKKIVATEEVHQKIARAFLFFLRLFHFKDEARLTLGVLSFRGKRQHLWNLSPPFEQED